MAELGEALAGAVLLAWGIGMLLRQWWRTEIELTGRGERWSLTVDTGFGWIHYRHQWPLPQTSRGVPSLRGLPQHWYNPNRVAVGLMGARLYNHLVRRLWQRMVIEQFRLQLILGLGEAGRTAQALGWLNALISSWVTARILPQTRDRPEWQVRPDWERVVVEAELHGVFRIRGSQVLATLLSAMVEGLTTALRRGWIWNWKVVSHTPSKD